MFFWHELLMKHKISVDFLYLYDGLMFLLTYDFISPMAFENIDGESLAHILKHVILQCDLSLKHCRSQGYDGVFNI